MHKSDLFIPVLALALDFDFLDFCLTGDTMSLRLGSLTERAETVDRPCPDLDFPFLSSVEAWLPPLCWRCLHFFGFTPAILLSLTIRSIDLRYLKEFLSLLALLKVLLLLILLFASSGKAAAIEPFSRINCC